MRQSAQVSVMLVAAIPLLSGCSTIGAPALPFFGAFFPSWLACTAAGLFGAVALRMIFIATGIDDALPVRLPVYVCLAVAIGFLVSIVGFGR